MAIPSGVILIWTGTNATIPTGWSRETTLDDKYPKGHGVQNPNTSGGNASHTHTSPAHNHIIAPHTHPYSYSWGNIDENRQGGNNLPDGAHGHFNETTANPDAAYTSSNAVTYGTMSNEPPYKTVIFIKPSGSMGMIKDGLCAHYNGTTLPHNWFFSDGANGSVDYRDKYLKGASTGADAGGTGGSTTNVHDITHSSHTGNSHTHGFTTAYNDSRSITQSGNWEMYNIGHSHTGTTGNSSTYAVGGFSGNLTTVEVVEPAYKKMGLIHNVGGREEIGLIGLWLGTIASIPTRWQVCDGSNETIDMRDKFMKIPSDLTGNNATGGSNTHTHAAQGHTHTGASHTHSLPRVYHWNGNGNANSPGDGNANGMYDHVYHEAVTSGATTDSWASTNTTADSSDNQPSYRTAAYIQLNKLDGGGSFLLNFI